MNRIQKIAQLFSPAAFVHDSEMEIQKLEALILKYQIGGLTFFHSRHSAAANFEGRQEKLMHENTLEKLKNLIIRYQKVSKTPLLISIDAEFGLAMRIEHTPQYPYAITLGQLQLENMDLVFSSGEQIGEDLKAVGVHLNLAPVVDINTNAKNPVIGYRSFGTDPDKVSQFAWAQYQGMKAAGISACYKHFPGHGDTSVDSHLGLPIIEKTKEQLLSEELIPFVHGIKQGVDIIMVGHLAVPALAAGELIPASISKAITTDFLRGELEFEGLVISDALNMKSVADLFQNKGELEWKAFEAGNDILCFSENIPEGIAKINEYASDQRIDFSFERMYQLKQKHGLLEDYHPVFQKLDFKKTDELNRKIAEKLLQVEIPSAQLHQFYSAAVKQQLIKVAAFGELDHPFFKILDQKFKSKSYQLEALPTAVLAQNSEKLFILLAIFLPSAKPVNHFGMDQASIARIKSILQNHRVMMIHFGNPLALDLLIPSNSSQEITIIKAYQNFEVFQEVIAQRLDFKEEK